MKRSNTPNLLKEKQFKSGSGRKTNRFIIYRNQTMGNSLVILSDDSFQLSHKIVNYTVNVVKVILSIEF